MRRRFIRIHVEIGDEETPSRVLEQTVFYDASYFPLDGNALREFGPGVIEDLIPHFNTFRR